ncbi:MAG: hypothetical protein RLT05_16355, partial [Bauldia litoralis]
MLGAGKVVLLVVVAVGVSSCLTTRTNPQELVEERYKVVELVDRRPVGETRDLLARMLQKCVVTDNASIIRAKARALAGKPVRIWTVHRTSSGNRVFRISIFGGSQYGTKAVVFVFDLEEEPQQTRIRMYHPFPSIGGSFVARMKRWLKGSESCSWFA